MKKGLKLFVILATMIFSTFSFASRTLVQTVEATYVEGPITQDTVWTLVDSPFVVVGNVTIESNAMLTIEPGVEVKFGGNFSLITEGRLYAKGTEEKPITFTSNKDEPEAGDWETIRFNGMQLSTLEHCIVKYAVNGITIERGNTLINRSEISHNLQNGVYIVDDNNATISENRIETNLNGIFVTGNSSGATIKQNRIYLNFQNGIRLETSTTTRILEVLIFNNSLSTNPVGIYIYGQVNANITRNSIAYNDLGILYENATNIMSLDYNDIYGNSLGARALSSDPVNAEYNYWGDESGPYHISLNPSGKGNPVESNGVDLDFIPFLTISNGYINQRPVAYLLADKLSVAPEDDVTFIATTSSDDRQVYRYFFDFGDGKNSGWTTLSIFMHKYNSVGTYNATLVVMDDFGVISSNLAEVTIKVQYLVPLNVYITLSCYTIGYGQSVSILVQVTNGSSVVESANVTLISVKGGTFQPISGLTNSTGCFTATFTAPNVTQINNLRLIATASKVSYADGSNYRYLQVLPPLLVQITAEPDFIGSGETSLIMINVTSCGEPVSNATVTLSSNSGGKFSPEIGTTDENGYATFTFIAVGTTTQKNITITARATKTGYVYGEAQTNITIEPRTSDVHIVQDTVWTLTDSPFVVVRDVIVESNVTLTIEPGVEVRFAENFSLLVKGKLYAKGTEEKPITFTSNKHQPEAGDWNTIKFTSTETSTLEYCSVEYATNGITIENSSVAIKNSMVSNNLKSGIYIIHENNVSLKGNWIAFNQNGVSIHGNASGVVTKQNRIFFNSQYGICLETNMTARILKVLIFNNSLSTNSVGIYVHGWVTANITRNSISYNDIGILYEDASDLIPPRHNDIYANINGMNVLMSEPVNAEYNYWGDESGSYHASLNPSGKGNPVGGNGVDLVFIPFLTMNNSHINHPPVANLMTDKALVLIDQTVTFIATNSSDDGRVYLYFFDFGDGKSSGWTTTSIFIHKYDSVGTYEATLMVMDDFGVTNNNTAKVTMNVQDDLASLCVNLTLSSYTIAYGEQISLLIQVTNGTNAVENATITLIAVKGGTFQPSFGFTNATGYFTAIFTAPNVTQITNIRLIATASKESYADSSDYKYLRVLPPLLVQITAEPDTIKSEETANIMVHVTYSGEPVSDADVRVSSDIDGNFSATSGTTDTNGYATFVFTAPQTLSQINVTITANATKMGYAEGHGQGTIIVEPKILVVEVTADTTIIVSEAVSTITAHVTYDAAPISNVTVTVSSDSGGNFSATTESTDSNGNTTFVFTAPQTTTMISATITVTATKSGYVNGEGQIAITIVPKVLTVQVTAEPNATVSEAKINVTVHVTYDMVSVPNASVTVTSENGGYFSATEGLTDLYGNATFIFTAPQVNEQSNITITVQASKIGYAVGENLSNITVNPGILSVEVNPSSPIINSRESTVVTVYVTCNGTPVKDALVTMSSTHGNFSVANGTTDPEGCCILVFNAPRATAQLSIIVTANVSKNGYISGQSETTITVTPETGGGWSLMTILLIIVPIVIVVIIVVLVKLKVITFSVEEEW